MVGIENYQMVEAFAANRADQPLRDSILPGLAGAASTS